MGGASTAVPPPPELCDLLLEHGGGLVPQRVRALAVRQLALHGSQARLHSGSGVASRSAKGWQRCCRSRAGYGLEACTCMVRKWTHPRMRCWFAACFPCLACSTAIWSRGEAAAPLARGGRGTPAAAPAGCSSAGSISEEMLSARLAPAAGALTAAPAGGLAVRLPTAAAAGAAGGDAAAASAYPTVGPVKRRVVPPGDSRLSSEGSPGAIGSLPASAAATAACTAADEWGAPAAAVAPSGGPPTAGSCGVLRAALAAAAAASSAARARASACSALWAASRVAPCASRSSDCAAGETACRAGRRSSEQTQTVKQQAYHQLAPFS